MLNICLFIYEFLYMNLLSQILKCRKYKMHMPMPTFSPNVYPINPYNLHNYVYIYIYVFTHTCLQLYTNVIKIPFLLVADLVIKSMIFPTLGSKHF